MAKKGEQGGGDPRLPQPRRASLTDYLLHENKWGLRHFIALIGFFGLAIGYIQRFCLSLAITEMVSYNKGPSKIDEHACPYNMNDTLVTRHAGEFDWDEHTQGLVLSSFFWGYVINQLPGGLMAERFGVKLVLGVGMFVSTTATILTPIISRSLGFWGLIFLRIGLGLGQGPLYPSLNVLMSNWTSQNERGRLGAIVFAGAQIGNCVSMAISGVIISWLGWTGVFYIFGGVGLIWCAIFFILYYNSPYDHPHIKEDEKTYIVTTSGRTHYKDMPPTPWIPILTSVPLWGLVIAQIGHDWGLFTIITDLPKYMKSVLHFDVRVNGLITGLPYLGMWIVAMVSGWLVDWMVLRLGWGVSFVRKLFITVASVGPAVGIIAASYAGCDKTWVSVFFILGMAIMGSFIPSLKVNALDLSPNYAGTMMALVGGIGAVSGIIAPYIVGLLTPDSTLLQWRLVFWISVAILVGTNFIYLFMGSAKTQWWNDPDQVREYSQANPNKA